MNTHNPNSERSEGEQSGIDPVDEAIKSIKASLLAGGPPVDSTLIMAFIDKELLPDAMPKVRALIDTWSDWNENYWSLHFAAASEHDGDEWLGTSDQKQVRQRTNDLLGGN